MQTSNIALFLLNLLFKDIRWTYVILIFVVIIYQHLKNVFKYQLYMIKITKKLEGGGAQEAQRHFLTPYNLFFFPLNRNIIFSFVFPFFKDLSHFHIFFLFYISDLNIIIQSQHQPWYVSSFGLDNSVSHVFSSLIC